MYNGEYCLDLVSDMFGFDPYAPADDDDDFDDDDGDVSFDDSVCENAMMYTCDDFESLGCCYATFSPVLDIPSCVNNYVYGDCGLEATPCANGALEITYQIESTMMFAGVSIDFANVTTYAEFQYFVANNIYQYFDAMAMYVPIEAEDVVVTSYSMSGARTLSSRRLTDTTAMMSIYMYGPAGTNYAGDVASYIAMDAFSDAMGTYTGADSVSVSGVSVETTKPKDSSAAGVTIALGALLAAMGIFFY